MDRVESVVMALAAFAGLGGAQQGRLHCNGVPWDSPGG